MAVKSYRETGKETGFVLHMPFLEVSNGKEKVYAPYIGKVEIYKGINVEHVVLGLIYSAAALMQDEGKSYIFTPELLEQWIKDGEERNQKMKKELGRMKRG